MMKYVCIHNHFYQPPRENPWLDYVEQEDSAYPFHDWNDRITKECYGPNAFSRILDQDGFVTELVNNYMQMSFNFGPTLLTWMEQQASEVYEAILDADRKSAALHNGHGNALAQVYNHIIMPLANRRDKETQIIWGIEDFKYRFGRNPEGMWLAETAVDLETLDIMASHGIKFTVLAPRQAKRVRRFTSGFMPGEGGAGSERSNADGDNLEQFETDWQDVTGERINTHKPYLVRCPSGASIACFFYDGHLSRSVAFEGLLHDGDTFAQALISSFDQDDGTAQLVHIATDGETYGHHHRHGEMALSYALHVISQQQDVSLINYGQFLELYPPTQEVEIIENSSWSCVHGVERWRENCGCNSGMQPGYTQTWRPGLREVCDWLRDQLSAPFADKLAQLGIADAWECRNDYVACLSDRSQSQSDAFLQRWRFNPETHTEAERTELFQALEMQRYLLYMYTSCGWFFDDVSGLESVQNLKYAYRALLLGQHVFKLKLEEEFRDYLRNIPSNIARFGDAEKVFEAQVAHAPVYLTSVGMHAAVCSLFHSFASDEAIYCYDVKFHKCHRFEAGRMKMVIGKMHVQHKYTYASDDFVFAALHFGDHNVNGGIRRESKGVDLGVLYSALHAKFNKGEIANLIRTLDRTFSGFLFTLKDLFRDDQRTILKQILQASLDDVEAGFKQIYNINYPLMGYLSDLNQPLPKVFLSVAKFHQNAIIESELEMENPDFLRLKTVIADAQRWGTVLDWDGINHRLLEVSDRMMEAVSSSEPSQLPQKLALLKNLVDFSAAEPLQADLWHLQNRFYLWMKDFLMRTATFHNRKDDKNLLDGAQQMIPQITELAASLKLRRPF